MKIFRASRVDSKYCRDARFTRECVVTTSLSRSIAVRPGKLRLKALPVRSIRHAYAAASRARESSRAAQSGEPGRRVTLHRAKDRMGTRRVGTAQDPLGLRIAGADQQPDGYSHRSHPVFRTHPMPSTV